LGGLKFIKEPIKSKGATILAKGKENANPKSKNAVYTHL
jgi:hypothetical protein